VARNEAIDHKILNTRVYM